MLALAFTVMLATSGLNDPGIGSPGLDSRVPGHAQQTSEITAAPQEATLPRDRTDPASRAYGRVQ
jgi:hypothetical protein